MNIPTRRHLIHDAIGISVPRAPAFVASPSIASPNWPGGSVLSDGDADPSARAISSIRIR